MSRTFILVTAVIAMTVGFVVAKDTAAEAEDDFLEENPSYGKLLIESDPDGARVTFDGEQVGVTPLVIHTFIPGRQYALELSLPGHFKRRATIQADSAGATFNFELSRPASLTVMSDPEGARVSVNIAQVTLEPLHPGDYAPVTRTRLRPGNYRVLATMDGYDRIDTTTQLASGANDTLRVTLSASVRDEAQIAALPPPQTPDAKPKKDRDKSSGKKNWLAETALIAFFVIIAVLVGAESSLY